MDPKFNGIVWTGSGLLDVQNPDPKLIDPKDVAHGLAVRYRFGGHTRRDLPLYSVAWHSLFCETVADQMGLPLWVRLQALLHDAPEYILFDVVTPLKRLLPEYVVLEGLVWSAVAKRFDIPEELHPAVHEIDNIALNVERLHLMVPGAWEPAPQVPEEWALIGERWIAFCQDRAQNGHTLAAALFHSRLVALLSAISQEVTE